MRFALYNICSEESQVLASHHSLFCAIYLFYLTFLLVPLTFSPATLARWRLWLLNTSGNGVGGGAGRTLV